MVMLDRFRKGAAEASFGLAFLLFECMILLAWQSKGIQMEWKNREYMFRNVIDEVAFPFYVDNHQLSRTSDMGYDSENDSNRLIHL